MDDGGAAEEKQQLLEAVRVKQNTSVWNTHVRGRTNPGNGAVSWSRVCTERGMQSLALAFVFVAAVIRNGFACLDSLDVVGLFSCSVSWAIQKEV